MTALVQADGLGMRYPARGGTEGRLALHGASFSIRPGEFLAVLGHNGCGKSTMLKCVAGLLGPSAGRIRLAGRDLTRLSGRALVEARMAMAMVFQQPRLVGRRSVLANTLSGTLGRHRHLVSALGLLPWSEQEHAMHCLARVGLAGFAAQRASTLSGGQVQRASIARALAQRPSVLLADEPVASLDPEASTDVMRMLRHVSADEGLGVICVLHQPELARRFADRVIGMRHARIVRDAPRAEVTDAAIAGLYEGIHQR